MSRIIAIAAIMLATGIGTASARSTLVVGQNWNMGQDRHSARAMSSQDARTYAQAKDRSAIRSAIRRAR